jgi:hypothetical protein
MPDILSDAQIIVMDTLRSSMSHLWLLSLPKEDPVRIAILAALREQEVSWEQFVEFVRK